LRKNEHPQGTKGIFSTHDLPLITGVAKAEELQSVRINPETCQGAHPVIQLFDGRNADIVDFAAILADKVIMRMHDGIEMAEARTEVQLPDLTLFFQNPQITIARAQAQAGKLSLELFINLIRSGVFPGVGQKLQDLLPLLRDPVVLRHLFHGHSPPAAAHRASPTKSLSMIAGRLCRDKNSFQVSLKAVADDFEGGKNLVPARA